MGLAALGPEKSQGRPPWAQKCTQGRLPPGHKQVLRSGNSRYTGRADYDLAQMRPQLQFPVWKFFFKLFKHDVTVRSID